MIYIGVFLVRFMKNKRAKPFIYKDLALLLFYSHSIVAGGLDVTS